jgi:putative addiction module component (TIGR02574 family)
MMSLSLEILEAEVLRLSAAERSRLLDRLIASLEADAEVEAEWDAIADRREAELDSGASKSVPFEEVMPDGIRILVVEHDRRRPNFGGSRR